MTGLVIKNTGSWYTVLTDDGQTIDCKIKGNFRLKDIRSTNPVAVGDRVVIVPTPSPSPQEGRLYDLAEGNDFQSPSRGEGIGVGFISAIEDRRNYIIRKSSNLSKQSHILAANVDQAFLVVTVRFPETSPTFIDRFLASAEAYSVPVVLVFNKIDRLDDENRAILEAMMRLYEAIGYECRAISAVSGEGVEELRPLLQGKITLLAGNSGVGKSTLINRLIPDAKLRTAEISDAHNTGMHTTTFSEMLRLPPVSQQGNHDGTASNTPSRGEGEGGGFLIDTPGIKGFGTFDMEPEELTSYFREIFHYSQDCKFSNCTHTHEPGCAVLKALDNAEIAPSRYQSYLSMMEDKDEDKYRAAY